MKKNIKLWIFCALMTFLLLGSWCFGSAAQASVQQDFINHLSPDVIKVAHRYNLYPSVMMAQAALESDFGQSSLAQEANNFFGVKGAYNGQSVQMPTMEYNQSGQPYYVTSSFRKYPSPYASIQDNAKLIRYGIYGNPAYYSGAWRENASDGITAANALGGKYATDPNYANNLVSLIQEYNLNSVLDSAWKRLHIRDLRRLKKRARQFLTKIRHIRRRYKISVTGNRQNRTSRAKFANYRAELVRYQKLYRNNQATLNRNYRSYAVYDHLNRLDLDNWKRLGAKMGKAVYIDMVGRRKGIRYYRIRLSPTQRHMYWVKSDVLNFARPIYYNHPYRINAQQIDRARQYNQILGTTPAVQIIRGKLRKAMYYGNKIALISNGVHPTWYHIKNDRGRFVWVAGNPKRPTQYLNYSEPKTMNRYYRNQAPLQNHASDAAYRGRIRSYSWSKVKPRNSRVNVDRLAINTRRHNQLWYRINNQHRTYWTTIRAFKG